MLQNNECYIAQIRGDKYDCQVFTLIVKNSTLE